MRGYATLTPIPEGRDRLWEGNGSSSWAETPRNVARGRYGNGSPTRISSSTSAAASAPTPRAECPITSACGRQRATASRAFARGNPSRLNIDVRVRCEAISLDTAGVRSGSGISTQDGSIGLLRPSPVATGAVPSSGRSGAGADGVFSLGTLETGIAVYGTFSGASRAGPSSSAAGTSSRNGGSILPQKDGCYLA